MQTRTIKNLEEKTQAFVDNAHQAPLYLDAEQRAILSDIYKEVYKDIMKFSLIDRLTDTERKLIVDKYKRFKDPNMNGITAYQCAWLDVIDDLFGEDTLNELIK